MTFFDLTQPIRADMPVYPGDPAVAFDPALTLMEDGANVTALALGSHTGTHLDAPAHVIANGQTVDQLELHLLHGPATILQLRHEVHPEQAIRHEDLVHIPDQLPNIVCIATGWDQYFQYPLREQHPYLTSALAESLWDRGARVLGVDTLSPDPPAPHTDGFAVHELWLGRGGIIVENLRSLTPLPDQVHMSLLPLPLENLDGSPIRAIAWTPSQQK